jgi:hypothetical protein
MQTRLSWSTITIENPPIAESEHANDDATCGEPVGLETSSIPKGNKDEFTIMALTKRKAREVKNEPHSS